MFTRKGLDDAARRTVAMETTGMFQYPHFIQMAATNDHGVVPRIRALFLGNHGLSSNERALYFSTALSNMHLLSHPPERCSIVTWRQGKQIHSRGQTRLAGREEEG